MDGGKLTYSTLDPSRQLWTSEPKLITQKVAGMEVQVQAVRDGPNGSEPSRGGIVGLTLGRT